MIPAQAQQTRRALQINRARVLQQIHTHMTQTNTFSQHQSDLSQFGVLEGLVPPPQTHAHTHTHARTHARTHTYIHTYIHPCPLTNAPAHTQRSLPNAHAHTQYLRLLKPNVFYVRISSRIRFRVILKETRKRRTCLRNNIKAHRTPNTHTHTHK